VTALTSQKATRAHRTYTINERFIIPTCVEQTSALDGNTRAASAPAPYRS